MLFSTRSPRVLRLLLRGLVPLASACTTFSGIPDLGTEGTGGAAAEGNGATTGTGEATGAAGQPGATGGGSGSGGGAGSGGGNGGAGTAGATSTSTGMTTGTSGAGTASSGGTTNDATQLCVDTINDYRATLGLPPYQRWADKEVCAADQATKDRETNTAHGAFGQCSESAQNECPNWPAPSESMITSCLAQMWAEGPGDDFPKHGHYINMSSTKYTKVACGFSTTVSGRLWAVQDFQ